MRFKSVDQVKWDGGCYRLVKIDGGCYRIVKIHGGCYRIVKMVLMKVAISCGGFTCHIKHEANLFVRQDGYKWRCGSGSPIPCASYQQDAFVCWADRLQTGTRGAFGASMEWRGC
uniref:Uncharacterized protein n=1 Tax=Oryza brachyantha TaxID=4533 RepID=J3M4B8_ORYBR